MHKRAGSGGNETATAETAQGNTAVSSDAKGALITPSSDLPASTSLATTSSQASLQEVNQASSATPVASTSVTTSTASLPIPDTTSTTSSLPTSINSSVSTDPTSALVPSSIVIPDEISSGIPTISSARQLLGTPANAPTPLASSTTEVPNQPVAPVPPATAVSVSSSASTSISVSSSTSISPSTSATTSVSSSASSQLPSAIAPNVSGTSDAAPSSLLLDTSMRTASLTSIAKPSFAVSASLSGRF